MYYFTFPFILLLTLSCNFQDKEDLLEPAPTDNRQGGPPPETNKSLPQEKEFQKEVSFYFYGEIRTDDDASSGFLGHILPESSVHIQISMKSRWGRYYAPTVRTLKEGQCRLAFDYGFWFGVPLFSFVRDLEGEFSRLELLINETSFNLGELVDQREIKAYWTDRFLNIEIADISQLEYVSDSGEDSLFLKIAPFNRSIFPVSIDFEESDCKSSRIRTYHEQFSIAVDSTIASSTSWKEGE